MFCLTSANPIGQRKAYLSNFISLCETFDFTLKVHPGSPGRRNEGLLTTRQHDR